MSETKSIIRKLKEKKKLILVSSIVFIVFIAILVPSIIYISNSREIEKLYEKVKNGILIEDQFLEHAEVVDYGGSIGRVLEPTDSFKFKIYAKAGDWCHAHYEADFCPIMFERGTGVWSVRTNWGGVNFKTFQFDESSIYTIKVYNYDDENDGYITFFLIIYTNEYYPPECPLC